MIAEATTKMLTLDEVAERLGVARRTVEEWVNNKDLASFKKGDQKRGCRRVSEEALAKFVLLHTLNPKRPEWLSAKVESEFWRRVDERIESKFNAEAQRRREEIAA